MGCHSPAPQGGLFMRNATLRFLALIFGVLLIGSGGSVQGQGAFAHGTVVALQGTPHLWIADEYGVLHWAGDTWALRWPARPLGRSGIDVSRWPNSRDFIRLAIPGFRPAYSRMVTRSIWSSGKPTGCSRSCSTFSLLQRRGAIRDQRQQLRLLCDGDRAAWEQALGHFRRWPPAFCAIGRYRCHRLSMLSRCITLNGQPMTQRIREALALLWYHNIEIQKGG